MERTGHSKDYPKLSVVISVFLVIYLFIYFYQLENGKIQIAPFHQLVAKLTKE